MGPTEEKLKMPEIAPGAATEQEPGASPQGDAQEPTPQSVAEAEAIWQKRFSNRDRAHNAEVAELRRQLEQVQRQVAASPPPPASDPKEQRIRELEAALAQQEAQREADRLAARFPKAAEYLGEALTKADTAKLAALEATLAGEQAAQQTPDARIVPAAAPRTPSGARPKTLDEMSKDELLGELRKISPLYRDHLESLKG